MLVEDTVRTCAMYIYTRRGKESTEYWAKIFHSLVLQGKLSSDVWWITEREKGSVFQPGDIFPKTGKPVLDVLHLEHLGARSPTAGSFKDYRGHHQRLCRWTSPMRWWLMSCNDCQERRGQEGLTWSDSIIGCCGSGPQVRSYKILPGSLRIGWPTYAHPWQPTGS